LLDTSSNQVFDFNETFAELVTQDGIEASHCAIDVSEGDLRQALAAAGEAAYRWNIESDEIIWSANAPEILGCHFAAIATGKQFASLLDHDNVTSRYDTVVNTRTRDGGQGVPFQIEYLFRSEGRQNTKAIWLEDVGRWQGGSDGLPKTVYGTVKRIDERHNRDQHLSFLGTCDPLTGMMNRGRMAEALSEAISVAKKSGGTCAFVIADINNLSLVNEAYGFDVADEVIVAAGRRLRQVMRVGDGIARHSGGKFGIILNDCTEADLEMALSRYMTVIRDNVIETGRGPVWAALSIGAINLPTDAEDANGAISRAEEALNEAHKLSSDGHVIYKPSEHRSAERALNARCATEIVKCLKQDRFKLAFQPIVNAKTKQADFHEALLRMQDTKSDELIAASHLIPIAEHLGLVRLVDRAVMQLIIQALHAYPEAHLSMNVSGITATDPYWYDQLLDVIFANGNAASRLTVEITETVALNDIRATRKFVEKLREAGCSVAIDDFGAGYTSFRHLRELPVNILKLDGSFCCDVKSNRDNEHMVRSLIDLSGKFNLKTVAEWVESAEDAEALTDWGIDYLQGNYLGEASIIVPWNKTETNRFDLSPRTAPEIHINVSATEEPVAPEHQLIAADAEIVMENGEAPITVETPTPGEENAAPAELDFADIDHSIANLLSALEDLSKACATPEAVTGDDESAERDAA
jgi:diguanylate cyclase (GGDEF)-like protein